MALDILVDVRDESLTSDEGSSGQDIIRTLRARTTMQLAADPINPHDQALTPAGQQIGFPPSDARDANAVLKIRKSDPDWSRRSQLETIAAPIDAQVQAAPVLELRRCIGGDPCHARCDRESLLADPYGPLCVGSPSPSGAGRSLEPAAEARSPLFRSLAGDRGVASDVSILLNPALKRPRPCASAPNACSLGHRSRPVQPFALRRPTPCQPARCLTEPALTYSTS